MAASPSSVSLRKLIVTEETGDLEEKGLWTGLGEAQDTKKGKDKAGNSSL